MFLKSIQSGVIMLTLSTPAFAAATGKTAPTPWLEPIAPTVVSTNVLYLPIASEIIKKIPIKGIDEELIDLQTLNNPRLRPLAKFDSKYKNTYNEYSKIRLGVYKKLLIMLDKLPANIGIAYFEGLRPLYKQKEYFDKKFKETLVSIPDKDEAYFETCKSISPFIDNVPTHCTGAAIDMTLFQTVNGKARLINMGKFDTIFGPNNQQETFSENTTVDQRNNRLMLLSVATQAGFVNYGFEWWHYSYGDRPWAYVKNQKEALYGLAVNKNDPILQIDKTDYLNKF